MGPRSKNIEDGYPEVPPKVTYPARGAKPVSPGRNEDEDRPSPGKKPVPEEPMVIDDETEEHGLFAVVQDTLDSIDANGGFWTSEVFRQDEDPPSAAVHFTMDGKRYVATFQPVDMADRAGR